MSSPQDPYNNDSLKNLILSRTGHIIHLTHNDLDGVGADAIQRLVRGSEGIITIWTSVGRFPTLFDLVASCPGRGDILSLSDLGYQRGSEITAERAQKNGWRVEWRDHHMWSEEEIHKIRSIIDLLDLDTSTCATGVMARGLALHHPQALEIAKVVCDYDLWKHKDPRSEVLGLVLQRQKNREHVRDCLVKGIFTDPLIVQEYTEIRKEMELFFTKSLRQTTVMTRNYRIAFAPLYGYASETAEFIRERLKTDMEVLIGGDGRFSLRSVPPLSNSIARHFEGGGHPHAAGGSFKFTWLERLIWSLLKRSRYIKSFCEIAEKYYR